MKKSLVFIICFALFYAGCANMVTINSNPPGAKCFVNNEYRGTTPVQTMVESWAVGGNPSIRLEKDGYRTFDGILLKKAQGGYIAIGVLLLWPMLLFNSTLVNGTYVFPLAPE